MAVVTTDAPPRGAAQLRGGERMSLEEFDALPDEVFPDDATVELLEGVVVVSSAPGDAHGYAQGRLFAVLDRVLPDDLVPVTGGGSVGAGSGTVPDLLVRRRQDYGDRRGVPVLAVEVASPSTRALDRGVKRRVYARQGVRAYWLVDLDVPAVDVLVLGDRGEYVEVGRVEGDEELDLVEPFAVRLRPSDLLLR